MPPYTGIPPGIIVSKEQALSPALTGQE